MHPPRPGALSVVCTGTVTWLLCDYGEVLSLPQPADDRARVEAAAGRGGEGFWADYWGYRPDYDRGDLSVRGYWATVAGRDLDDGDLGRLVVADVASWLHPDIRALAGAGRAARRGLRLALLSNAPTEVASAIDASAWISGFMPRLFSCRLGAVKPEPAAFEATLDALGAPPGEVVFLDDRPANVDAARQLGIRAELYRSPAQFDAVSA